MEEAVPEKLDIKHGTLRRISDAAPADAVIGSNTSTISIAQLAEVVENPGRFLGVTPETKLAVTRALKENHIKLHGFRNEQGLHK